MKHLSTEMWAWGLEVICAADAEVSAAAAETMLRHLEWLLETNRNLNLTAITDPHEAVRLHILDSLTGLPEVRGALAGSMIDVGSGGGYPGVPLALCTGRHTVLMDSVKKKVRALEGFLLQENLDSWISVSDLRAEEYAQTWPESAAVVTARAVAELPVLVEWAAPLLVHGGTFVALKGSPSDGELLRGDTAARLCGLERTGSREAAVSTGREARLVVSYRKVGAPTLALPRRVGMARSKPLA